MEAAWVYLPYYCLLDEGYNHCWHFRKTQSQLTHILKWRRRKRRCERKKEDRPKRKIKLYRQATGWQRQSVRDEEKGGKEESRWYRQQNEQVIEVKWWWKQERKKKRKRGATCEKSNMGSVQLRRVGKRACYGSPLGFPRQIVLFPNLFWGAAQPHLGTREGVKMGLLKTDETRCFWCHLERTKAWFPVLPVTQRVLCSLLNSSRLFLLLLLLSGL